MGPAVLLSILLAVRHGFYRQNVIFLFFLDASVP